MFEGLKLIWHKILSEQQSCKVKCLLFFPPQVSLSEFLRTSDLSSCDALQLRLAQELPRSDRAKRFPVEPKAGRRFLRWDRVK